MPRVYASPTGDAIVAVVERDGPVSARAIAEALGMPRNWMGDPLQRLRHPKRKRIRIAEWQPPEDRGRWTPLYVIGSGPDAPEPPALSHKARNATYRQRHRYELRARTQARRGRPVVPASWLPGLL